MLAPIFGVTITPSRPAFDSLGNPTPVDLPSITNAVFALNGPSADDDSSLYSQGGDLFVPRGSDLRNGDRVTYQGRIFGIVGEAQWDMDHPMTGEDFGYVAYTIRYGG